MKRRLYIIAALIFMLDMIIFAQQPETQNSKLKIQNAWVRPAAKGANSALYFVIVNNSTKTDTLLGAQSNVAEETEVHESFKKDNDRMGMRPAGKISIKPKSEFEFKPGGFHVMLLGVLKDLKFGDKIEAVLLLKYAGKLKLKAEIRDMPMTNKTQQ